jgi:hypothetical protein
LACEPAPSWYPPPYRNTITRFSVALPAPVQTRRGIYDNMKTTADKVKKGKGRIVTARFAVMCAHYL